ncbi:MAG: hypothetical protein JSV76_01205 [Candidatus Bathyarchaeota archaeon]|nr:MAG: hypothetical protein JSV76_01205 [Candidatus Bathyarchaeota archaeon]
MSKSETEERKRPIKLEDAATETGELIGKGLKKAWKVTKSFGTGLVDSLEEKTESKSHTPPKCQHCSTKVTPHSKFSASCGKKL